MSTETEPAPESSEAAIAAMVLEPPGFGARLRMARERSGHGASEVADKLHCDVSVITALETENLPALGAAVYARGHLRRYAEYLNLPAPELIALYDQRKDHAGAVPDLTRIAQVERPRDPNRALRWVYVVVAGLIGLFAVWWVLQSPRGAANSPPTGATPQAAAPSAALPVSQPAPAAAPARAADAAIVKLGLRARADCWIEVYDIEGRQLFFDLARRGTRQDVAGAGPLRLVLGNAPAIRLELAGRELTVPVAMQRKSTAFITVTADGRIEPAR